MASADNLSTRPGRPSAHAQARWRRYAPSRHTAAFLEKVDFDDDGTGDARRLYPLGRSVPVVLDPDHGFGEPTLTTGARTEAIAELVAAGETRERVATVYDITVDDVDSAVRYEHDRAA